MEAVSDWIGSGEVQASNPKPSVRSFVWVSIQEIMVSVARCVINATAGFFRCILQEILAKKGDVHAVLHWFTWPFSRWLQKVHFFKEPHLVN